MPISLQFVLEEVLGQAKRPQVERKDSSPKFSRYCTKHLGQSPSEYRQSLQPK